MRVKLLGSSVMLLSNRAIEYATDQIIPELQRQMALPQDDRPMLSVFTNDPERPEHTGGMEYVPMLLDSSLRLWQRS